MSQESISSTESRVLEPSSGAPPNSLANNADMNSNPLGAISSNLFNTSNEGLSQINPGNRDENQSGKPPLPNSKPDRMKNTGIGVLIDTDSLMAEKGSKEARNPYYIVLKGRRYYGSSPRAVVRTFREQYNTNLRSGKLGATNSKPGVVRSFLSSAKNFSRRAGTAALSASRRVGSAAASGAAAAARGTARLGSAAARGTARLGSAAARGTARLGSAAARGATGIYSSTQTRYASWKQERANAAIARSAANTAARGECGFVRGDPVIVENPTAEHGSEKGKLGTVQNVQPPGDENCLVMVRMSRGDLIAFAKEELRIATGRDRIGNVSRRFSKGFTKRSAAAGQGVRSGSTAAYQRLRTGVGSTSRRIGERMGRRYTRPSEANLQARASRNPRPGSLAAAQPAQEASTGGRRNYSRKHRN